MTAAIPETVAVSHTSPGAVPEYVHVNVIDAPPGLVSPLDLALQPGVGVLRA